jgi:hypothetical protein
MPATRLLLTAAVTTACASTGLAQTNISSTHKHSWSENCGWMNWRDAGRLADTQGVRLSADEHIFSGFVWGENIGWINLGSGSPQSGLNYSNASGADFGVNHDPNTGLLSGMAWGENVGWINFDAGAAAGSSYAARIVVDAPRRLYGYIWGENIGWINLDDADHYVEINTCPADFNENGVVSVQDIFDFLVAYFAADAAADFNASGAVSVQDIFDYLAAYFAGC